MSSARSATLLDGPLVLVDTVRLCQAAVAELSREPAVALDLEGIELGRSGSICTVQVTAGAGRPVYVFDVVKLMHAVFDVGNLRALLQNPGITKVVFDGRGDNDALHHQFNAKMHNVYDVQVLYVCRFCHRGHDFLQGLGKAMEKYGSQYLNATQRRSLERTKEHGLQKFAPDHGGSYHVWSERPLDVQLLEYAASDVRLLLDMKRVWGGPTYDADVVRISRERIDNQVHARVEIRGREKARRDFAWPSWTCSGGSGRVFDFENRDDFDDQCEDLGYISDYLHDDFDGYPDASDRYDSDGNCDFDW